jgi:hypothetical protein
MIAIKWVYFDVSMHTHIEYGSVLSRILPWYFPCKCTASNTLCSSFYPFPLTLCCSTVISVFHFVLSQHKCDAFQYYSFPIILFLLPIILILLWNIQIPPLCKWNSLLLKERISSWVFLIIKNAHRFLISEFLELYI